MAGKRGFHKGLFGNKRNNLFGAGPITHLNACVGKNGGYADFGRYAKGYFHAGEWLIKGLVDNSLTVDLAIYPLVMTYRHGVEDMLKQLALTTSFLFTGEQEVRMTHNLLDNWAIAKCYLPKLEVPKAEIDEAESILKDLVEMDPKGEVFRYPRSRDGEQHLEGTGLINVVVFAETITKLAEFLESCWSWAEHNVQLKFDMESQMRQDYHNERYS